MSRRSYLEISPLCYILNVPNLFYFIFLKCFLIKDMNIILFSITLQTFKSTNQLNYYLDVKNVCIAQWYIVSIVKESNSTVSISPSVT